MPRQRSNDALRDFASAARPLRISSLPSLLRCAWASVADFLQLCDRESSEAADTGSAAHMAVATWHRQGRDDDAAVAAMKQSDQFPKADLADAERFFRAYAADPRNREAEVVAVEREVRLEVKAGKKAPIVMQGTLDQLRLVDGVPYLWDVKTGSRGGYEQLHDYAAQLAGYVWAARHSGFDRCEPGGIIRVRGYHARGAELPSPTGVFFHAAFSADDAERILASVVDRVLEIRAGRVAIQPGAQCTFCPLRGLSSCLPLFTETLLHGEKDSRRRFQLV